MVRTLQCEPSVRDSLVICQKNLMGTAVLAIAALGLTAVVYIANWYKAPAFPTHENKTSASASGSLSVDAATHARAGSNQTSSSIPRPRPPLSSAPNILPKCYFTLQAECHVKRISNSLAEWQDDALGISIPFSPMLFAIKHEVRQAPMVLLTMSYLRQEGHRVMITIEETVTPETAENYRRMSLLKIADCSRILSASITRIGNYQYPQAEYCYVNEDNQLVYVLSIFLTHGGLALTLQYSANSPVHPILPTAFSELVRAVRFSHPRPSPSYFLVSEPRLGLGFRLPLDFRVYEGLPENIEEAYYYYPNRHPGCDSSNVHSCGAQVGIPCYDVGTRTLSDLPTDGNRFREQGCFPQDRSPTFLPFATAVGCGMRCMGIMACYEPSITIFSGGSGNEYSVSAAQQAAFYSNRSRSPELGAMKTNDGVDGSMNMAANLPWHIDLQQQLQNSILRLGIHTTHPAHVFFRDEVNTRNDQEPSIPPNSIVIRPYRLLVLKQGNFSNPEDEEDAARNTLLLLGLCCLQEVQLEPDSPCLGLISNKIYSQKSTMWNSHLAPVVRPRVYFGAFYIPIANECVGFYFFASVTEHSFEDFASFCAATMQSVSLGNHNGQATSLLYCNMKHTLLPFSLNLRPGSDVQEPQLGDPLALVRVDSGAAVIAPVLLRMFPLQEVDFSGPRHPTLAATATHTTQISGSVAFQSIGTCSEKYPTVPLIPAIPPGKTVKPKAQHRLLESTVHWYLCQMFTKQDSGIARILQWEPLILNAMPALLVCFELNHSGRDVIHELVSTTKSLHKEAGVGAAFGNDKTEGLVNGVNHQKGDLDSSSELTSESMLGHTLALEEDMGSFNPFSEYFSPLGPPPSNYFRSHLSLPTDLELVSEAKSGVKSKENTQLESHQTSGARGDTLLEEPSANNTAACEGKSSMLNYRCGTSGRGSVRIGLQGADIFSDQNTLRVGVALYAGGNAFLCLAPASKYSLKTVRETVQTLASNFVLLHSS